MKLSAIVPVWNGRDLLERLLRSLAAQTTPADELLVIDNGSRDGAPELAREFGARVVAMGFNAGFAAAVNRGIAEARGEWIAVLNSDVELSPDYFARLLASEGWFATGKILSSTDPDRIDGTFDVVCRGGAPYRVGNGAADGEWFAGERTIWSAPFTAAIFRAELFRRAGVLEERFESYLEDVDFGLRCARLKLEGQYVPAAVAWHKGSGTLGAWHPETVRRMSRNQVFLLARHYPPALMWRWLWPIVVAQMLWGALSVRHRTALPWLRGKWQGLRDYRVMTGSIRPFDSKVLEVLMESNERIIRDAQEGQSDSYWRLYFLLTGGGTK